MLRKWWQEFECFPLPLKIYCGILALTVCAIIFCLVFAMCIPWATPESRAEFEAQQYELGRKGTAKRVVANLIYVKDSRTGLCFAHYNGSITAVPELSVPKDLLLTVEFVKP